MLVLRERGLLDMVSMESGLVISLVSTMPHSVM